MLMVSHKVPFGEAHPMMFFRKATPAPSVRRPNPDAIVLGPYLGHAPQFTRRPIDDVWADPRFNIEAGKAAR